MRVTAKGALSMPRLWLEIALSPDFADKLATEMNRAQPLSSLIIRWSGSQLLIQLTSRPIEAGRMRPLL